MEIGKNERISFQTTRARKTAAPVSFGEFQASAGRTHVTLDNGGQSAFSGLIKVRIGINPYNLISHKL